MKAWCIAKTDHHSDGNGFANGEPWAFFPLVNQSLQLFGTQRRSFSSIHRSTSTTRSKWTMRSFAPESTRKNLTQKGHETKTLKLNPIFALVGDMYTYIYIISKSNIYIYNTYYPLSSQLYPRDFNDLKQEPQHQHMVSSRLRHHHSSNLAPGKRGAWTGPSASPFSKCFPRVSRWKKTAARPKWIGTSWEISQETIWLPWNIGVLHIFT